MATLNQCFADILKYTSLSRRTKLILLRCTYACMNYPLCFVVYLSVYYCGS
jgi:hypothetical protein